MKKYYILQIESERILIQNLNSLYYYHIKLCAAYKFEQADHYKVSYPTKQIAEGVLKDVISSPKVRLKYMIICKDT